MKHRLIALLLLALGFCLALAAQQGPSTITVEGLDGKKMTFTVEQLRQMPPQSVTMNNPHTKATESYSGVLLADLLAKVSAPSGDKLRGEEMRDYVEVTGRDGYSAVFGCVENTCAGGT